MLKIIQKRKAYARFTDNILAVDLLKISSKNQGVKYQSCAPDVFMKYVPS